jgi:hypothetical protein
MRCSEVVAPLNPQGSHASTECTAYNSHSGYILPPEGPKTTQRASRRLGHNRNLLGYAPMPIAVTGAEGSKGATERQSDTSEGASLVRAHATVDISDQRAPDLSQTVQSNVKSVLLLCQPNG